MHGPSALILHLFLFGVMAFAFPQEKGKIKPLPLGASVDETAKWLGDAISTAASYRTDERSVSISDVKFEACDLSFATSKKYGSRSYATMGTTKSSTSVTGRFSIDLKTVSPDGIYLTGSLIPQLTAIAFSKASYHPSDSPLGVLAAADPGKLAEIEIKRSEAENLKNGLIVAARLCQAAR